jgi:hypothetical protein
MQYTAGSGGRAARDGTTRRRSRDMGLYFKRRTTSRCAWGGERVMKGGREGSYGKRDSGHEEDLLWSRRFFYYLDRLHEGHKHHLYLISRVQLCTHPSSLVQRPPRSLLRHLKPLTPQVLHRSFSKTSRPLLRSSFLPRLPQHRVSLL